VTEDGSADPIRILHCHSTFSLGGKEARAVRLMNAFGGAASHVVLSAMPDQLAARDAIAPDIAVAFPGDAGAPPLHGKPGLRRYRALARTMQAFDLILSYNWGSMDAVMAHRLWSPFLRLPPLIHHEDGFNADEADGLNAKRSLFRRIALPTARAVVVPSHRLERTAKAAWGDPLPVRRISNGIDVARYRLPPEADAIPGLVRGEGDLVIGTIAGLRAVKDLPLLVQTLALLPPHVRLVIVGEGPERARIAAEADRLGIMDRVTMPGFLGDPHRYVGHFDIMALSSLSEQQPIAVMEAMAAGLPVVAPPVGDIAEMVSQANAPFIVGRSASELAKAVMTLADNQRMRGHVGAANAAKALAAFDERRMIAAYAALYGEALGRSLPVDC
jgi:L-malate glycosyltransferase